MIEMRTDIEETGIDAAEHFSRSVNERVKQLAWLLFSFKGRLDRGQYFLSGIFVYGVPLLSYFIVTTFAESGFTTISSPLKWGKSSDLWQTAAFIPAIAILMWGSLATSFKRLHDLGQSLGAYIALALVGLIPFVGFFVPLYLLLLPGEPKANEYGKGLAGRIGSRTRALLSLPRTRR